MKAKIYEELLKLEKAFTFTIPQEALGFRLVMMSSVAVPWNLLLYTSKHQLVGQAMSFNVEKELWIGPELEYTSPYCLPLKEERTFHLFNLPMADYPRDFPEMKVEVICYEDRNAWIKEFPLSFTLSRQEAPLEYWIDEEHLGELVRFDEKKVPSDHFKAKQDSWFAGDLHTHTFYSDGQCSPLDNLNTAKKYGLDFFAATDHTIFPYAWPKDEEILVLPSTEITTAQGHWNLHFSTRSPYDGLNLQEGLDLDTLLTCASGLGDLSINHPFMNPWEMNFQNFPLSLASTMEVLNDPTYKNAALSADKALKAWSLLWNWGHDITGIGGSDAHLRPDESYLGQEEPSRLGDPITWIRAEELSAHALRQGLRKKEVAIARAGRPSLRLSENPINGLYAGQSAIGKHVHLDEVELRFELLDAKRDDLYHQWILDGEVVEEIQGISSIKSFSSKDGHWIRVDLRLSTGELYGTTNPLRLKDSPKKGETWGDLLRELRPEIKGVIFDKDGTLLQFTDLWMHSTRHYLDLLELSPENRRNCELALGLESRRVRENSPLSSGTLDQIIQCIEPFAGRIKPKREDLVKVYSEHLYRFPEEVKTTGDLGSLFRNLRSKKLKLGVLTSDDESLAKQAFEMVGISDAFDFIGGGDSYEPKPSPQGIYAACATLGLAPEEILFVGDSLADMHLKKYVGKVLGIASEVGSHRSLKPWADALIHRIEDVALYV